jgi:hypothetical protein
MGKYQYQPGYFTVPHPFEGNYKSIKEKKLRHTRVFREIPARECTYPDLLLKPGNSRAHILHEVSGEKYKHTQRGGKANISKITNTNILQFQK